MSPRLLDLNSESLEELFLILQEPHSAPQLVSSPGGVTASNLVVSFEEKGARPEHKSCVARKADPVPSGRALQVPVEEETESLQVNPLHGQLRPH